MRQRASASPNGAKPRALISVSDKTGMTELAEGLAELGYEVISTGGSAKVRFCFALASDSYLVILVLVAGRGLSSCCVTILLLLCVVHLDLKPSQRVDFCFFLFLL